MKIYCRSKSCVNSCLGMFVLYEVIPTHVTSIQDTSSTHLSYMWTPNLRRSSISAYVPSIFGNATANLTTSAQFGRNNSYQPRFVTIPPDLDINGNNSSIVTAALVAGLFPKILSVDESTSQMRTISNNQQVSFHPSSVNFRMRPKELTVNYLAYYTLM